MRSKTNNTMILEIKNVTSGYNHLPIIKNISFDVEEGTLTGIIGPNGSGKSTLFKTITGYLRLWNGTISYNSLDITRIPHRTFFREISAVPQIVEIPFSFTVKEIVSMGRYPHISRWGNLNEQDHLLVDKAMEFADVLHLKDRTIDRVSGGERQRVLLAQALAQEPKLLLLDEPIAHLDIGHQIKFLNLLKKLNQQNKMTVLIILHDLNLASEYCDNIVLLDKGEVYDIGIPEKVLTYQNIENVYDTVIVTQKNPVSSKMHIFTVAEHNVHTP